MSDNKIKLIFFGTPEFAKIILAKLFEIQNFEILAVITESDKRAGRDYELKISAVKKFAQENHTFILQPEKLDDEFYNELAKFESDFFIVSAYGKIIPERFLNLPKKGAINVHPSMLPKYRGASPIQSALLKGENKTGVTIMLMDKLMDHGPILSQIQVPIIADETYIDLSQKLADIGAELLTKTILDYFLNKIQPQEQNHSIATICHLLKKSDGEIGWHKTANEIYNQFRAFISWPGVFSNMKIQNHDLLIKFIELKLSNLKNNKLIAGEFFVNEKKLYIVCGEATCLEVLKLQPAGKKVQTQTEFINGYLKI